MSKMRVYEYAKKQNLTSKEVITKLKDMNIEVSNHMTMIEDEAVVKLDGIFQKKEGNKAGNNSESSNNQEKKKMAIKPIKPANNDEDNEQVQHVVREKVVKPVNKKPVQNSQFKSKRRLQSK